MAHFVAKISLDTFRKNNIKPLIVPQYDYGNRYVDVSIYADGKHVIVSDSDDVFINANRRTDGQSYSFTGSVNQDGSIRVPITQQMTENIGDVYCTISIKDQSGQVSTTSFLIEVIYNPNGGTAVPDSDDVFVELDERIDEIENIIQTLGTVMRIKGTKSTYAEVEALTDAENGDVWIVTERNAEYVKTQSGWVEFGPTVDLTNYVQKTDVPTTDRVGPVKLFSGCGLRWNSVNGYVGLCTDYPQPNTVRNGSNDYSGLCKPIVPYIQHFSAFYGLAKAAGYNMAYHNDGTAPGSAASNEDPTPGIYPSPAKIAIQNMLGAQAAVEVVRLI